MSAANTKRFEELRVEFGELADQLHVTAGLYERQILLKKIGCVLAETREILDRSQRELYKKLSPPKGS